MKKPVVKLERGGFENVLAIDGRLCCHGCHRPFGAPKQIYKDDKGSVVKIEGTGLAARKVRVKYGESWGIAYLCQYCIKKGMKEGRIGVENKT